MFDPKDQNISTGNRLPFLFFVDTNYGQDYGNGGLVNDQRLNENRFQDGLEVSQPDHKAVL